MNSVRTKRYLLAFGAVVVLLILTGVIPSIGKESQPSPTPKPPAAAPTRPKATALTKPYVIVAAGDIACAVKDERGRDNVCRDRSTAELIQKLHPDSVLALGDDQYETGALSDYLGAYDKTWGRFKLVTMPVVGNHEYASRGAAGYFQYFGSRAGTAHKGWYSFEIGTWHLIALNSNCSIVKCIEDSEQARWLLSDLKAHPAPCTLAFWHHPLFSSGLHQGEFALTYFWDTLDKAGADLVLSGHDHTYERFGSLDAMGHETPNGVRQFVVGTGGRSLYPFVHIQKGSVVRFNRDFGVLKLTLYQRSYAWEFITVDGKSIDSGRAACV